MKVNIPAFKEKKELFTYLKANKELLASQKKSMPIYSDVTITVPTKVKDANATKANNQILEDSDILRVKVVANTANWVDSQMDMLLPDSYNKSIQDRKYSIPHLHDHIHQLSAKIGEVVDIYTSTMSYSELGIKGIGTTTALIFITDVMKKYNPQIFDQYKSGKVNQHSIGLQYVKLELAVNDPESEKEFDFWTKYYDQVINKNIVDQSGFFWVVPEIKVYENSAVLFGSNEITPTLDNNVKQESAFATHTEPDNSTLSKEEELKDYLLNLLK